MNHALSYVRSAVLAAATLGAFAAAPASAQVLGSAPYAPAPDPVIERLQTRVDSLEAELTRATGRSEQLGFELSQARKTAEQANVGRMELEKLVQQQMMRIDALEALARGEVDQLAEVVTEPTSGVISLTSASGPAEAPGGLASRIDISTLPTDEAELLKEAREWLLSGNYPAAEQALTHYVAQHPKSGQTDAAQYLLGESLLYQEKYADAAAAYGALLSNHPKSERGPEALVKLSRSLRLLGQKSEACQALGLMNSQFPRASQTAKTLAAAERSRAGC